MSRKSLRSFGRPFAARARADAAALAAAADANSAAIAAECGQLTLSPMLGGRRK